MCGITGALDLTGTREFPKHRLLAMSHAIQHRGPDDEQIHIEPGLALGIRRLAIIDVDHGHQPVTNENGNVIAVVNGELFDYLALQKETIMRGHQLRNRCDSELWVHLYEDLGEKMFERTHGQFAISLWDRSQRKLILARDRVGICPLYYTISDGWLLWGSEIKALLASGLVTAKPDFKGIDYLFNFFCSGSTRTFFEGIHLLAPGHYLQVTNGQLKSVKYWDLDFPDAGEEQRFDNPKPLIDELEWRLSNAIKRRLRSDVPLASYLSGGIDSSMLLELGSRLHGKAIPSFTIGFNNKTGPDERRCSEKTASLLGSPLTTLILDSSQIAEAFPEFICAAEGPVLDTSCTALMLLAAEVRKQGYKVVLSGEGADEALAGYFWFKTQKVGNKIHGSLGPTLPNLISKLLQASISYGPNRRSGMPIHGVRTAQQYMYDIVSRARERLYSENMWEKLVDHNPYDDLAITTDNLKRWHPLNQSLYVGYKVMLPGLLMMGKGDRITMHSSIEARYPFLDEDVISFCASIAPEYKLRGMTEKWLLRQLAAKNLPRKIATRPKQMFRSVLSKIFLGPHRPKWVDQLLSPESLQRSGYFDPKAVARERFLQTNLPRITPRQFVFDAALTCVITTQLWHHLFFGGGLCDLPTHNIHS